MTKAELEKLHRLLTGLQHLVEDTNKEGGRTLGRAKDYVGVLISEREL